MFRKLIFINICWGTLATVPSPPEASSTNKEFQLQSFFITKQGKVIGINSPKSTNVSSPKFNNFLKDLKKIVGNNDSIGLIGLLDKSIKCQSLRQRKKKARSKSECKPSPLVGRIKRNSGEFWNRMKEYLKGGYKKVDNKIFIPASLEFYEQTKKVGFYDKAEKAKILSIDEITHSYGQFYFNQDVKVYDNFLGREKYTVIPRGHFIQPRSMFECYSKYLPERCKGWHQIETFYGMRGYINYEDQKVYPIEYLTGFVVKKTEDGFKIDKFITEAPCIHCKDAE